MKHDMQHAGGRRLRKWQWVTVAVVVVVIAMAAAFTFMLARQSGGLTESVEVDEALDAPGALAVADTLEAEPQHEWLDMGTSVKWATCNLGASSPKEHGDYFAWGEAAPAPGLDYVKAACRLYGNGVGSIAGDSVYDAATASWGGDWRMPTKAEFKELISKCELTWYGDGMEVKAKNGNVLYLPAAGFRAGDTLSGDSIDCNDSYLIEIGYEDDTPDGTSTYVAVDYKPRHPDPIGMYWCATPPGNGSYAWRIIVSTTGMAFDQGFRFIGCSVRPVRE